ncbi:NAD-dependent epimerase/dehydratase family protein [Bacillus atrophaeus]|uniref:NAD-dependent epimerase/dehydratase family protein n=1 Tax=Bacillus atrophaeus TaxID=1452 RepID=UPI003EB7E018
MMKQHPILITGGTGTTGSRIAKRLIERGYQVRIASRRTAVISGAEHVYFDWNDESTFKPALEHVKRIYLVAPVGVFDPSPYVFPFLEEAVRLGAERVVMLSASVVLEDGPVFGKLHQAVRQQFPEWAVLQPSYFMQNFINAQHGLAIKNEDKIVTAAGDGKLGFVDAGDIAEVGMHALTDELPHNTNHVITGPQALSYSEAASMIGSVIGRPVKHENISLSALSERMMKAGLAEEYAHFMAGLDEAIRNGAENRVTDTVLRVTGRKPRSFSEFVTVHADNWRREAEGTL